MSHLLSEAGLEVLLKQRSDAESYLSPVSGLDGNLSVIDHTLDTSGQGIITATEEQACSPAPLVHSTPRPGCRPRRQLSQVPASPPPPSVAIHLLQAVLRGLG